MGNFSPANSLPPETTRSQPHERRRTSATTTDPEHCTGLNVIDGYKQCKDFATNSVRDAWGVSIEEFGDIAKRAGCRVQCNGLCAAFSVIQGIRHVFRRNRRSHLLLANGGKMSQTPIRDCAGLVMMGVAVAAFLGPGCGKRSTEANPSDNGSLESKTPEEARSNPDALAEGTAQMESGDNAAALTAFTRAIQAAPSDSKPLVLRAFVLMKLRKVQAALADLNRAIGLNPKDGDAYEQRAMILAGGGATVPAIQDFTNAIRFKPLHMKLFIDRGLCFERLKMFAKAEADYDEAHRLVPKSGLPYEYRGGVFFDQGKLDAALAEFDEAVRLSPDLAEIYFNRAAVHEKMHHSEQALADFNTAIRLDSQFANAYKRRAAIYFADGRAADARRDLAKARELEQADIAAHEANGAGNP